jgi:hypothetical protein
MRSKLVLLALVVAVAAASLGPSVAHAVDRSFPGFRFCLGPNNQGKRVSDLMRCPPGYREGAICRLPDDSLVEVGSYATCITQKGEVVLLMGSGRGVFCRLLDDTVFEVRSPSECSEREGLVENSRN